MTDMDPVWGKAIKNIESSGGRYDLVGPASRKGDRPYGAYQVMGANIPSWTKEVLGRSMTPQEFLADTAAQDQVFNSKFGGYVQKYGSPQEAASMWFSGRPIAQAGNRSDVLGTTVPGYLKKFNGYLDNGGEMAGLQAKAPQSGANAIEAAMRNYQQPEQQGGGVMSFASQDEQGGASPEPKEDGFLSGGLGGLIGLPNGKTKGGYDVGRALGNAGAAMMALDNPSGAAVLAGQVKQDDMNALLAKKAGTQFSFKYDPTSGTMFRLGSDGSVSPIKTGTGEASAGGGLPGAKFNEKVLKSVNENMEKYDYVAQTGKAAAGVYDDLKTGKLDLGLLKNWLNSGKNMAGVSDDQSRAFARFEQFRQQLANDELRLNKGVQTDGDAYREMKSFVAGAANFDNESAMQSLKRVYDKGQDNVKNRGRSILSSYQNVYGDAPFKSSVEQADRWDSQYDEMNKRFENYKQPAAKPTASPPSSSWKVLGVVPPRK